MSKSKLAFSIIIPTLNEAKYLPHLLVDLGAQSFQDFEVIVVDGKSDDATVTSANHYLTTLPSLTVLTSPQRNVSVQRNLGAKQAQADWLIFMDADNRLPPYFLQGIKYRIECSQPDVFSTYLKPDSDKSADKLLINVINLHLETQKNTTHAAIMESLLGFKTKLFHQLNGFDPSFLWGEGGDLCQRALKRGAKFHFFKDPQYIYSLRRLRRQGTLITATKVAQLEIARLLNRPIKGRKASKMYPMNGGSFTEDTSSPIVRALNQLRHTKTLPQKYLNRFNTFYKKDSPLSRIIQFFLE